ncbi:MAG: hypothetical protein N4A46_03595 [Schleiferiaceae bacterium]|nr:hypothetical protein [Schleiferiaceae bacterium]
MKNTLWLFFVLIIGSCVSNDKPPKEEKEHTEQVDSTQIKDSIASFNRLLEEERLRLVKEEEKYFSKLEIRIYDFYSIEHLEGHKFGFVPLADGVKWSNHPDSSFIEPEYLGNITLKSNEDDLFHYLDDEYKKRILQGSGFSEGDSLYVYSGIKDSTYAYAVNNLQLVAFLNPYGAYQPIEQYDYMFGFKLDDPGLKEIWYTDPLVYVGPKNPFTKGKVKPIKWELVDSSLFSLEVLTTEDSTRFHSYGAGSTYHHKNDGLEYIMRCYGEAHYPSEEVLVIRDIESKIIIKTLHYQDSEGSYLTPLNYLHKSDWRDEYQYAGQLFKHKSPVVFGFMGMSFGCPAIDVLDSTNTRYYIHCDNRH